MDAKMRFRIKYGLSGILRMIYPSLSRAKLMPVSQTAKSIYLDEDSLESRISTDKVILPSSLNFIAFMSRLRSIWLSFSESI